MNSTTPKMPNTVLSPIIEKSEPHYTVGIYCAGLEGGEWRANTLAQSLMAWLPDFALIPDEAMDDELDNSWQRFRVAANKIYKTGFPEKRGEIGELILHILCRKYFDTYPSVSKIYYKSSGGEVVKGFDLVHTKYDEKDDEVEFWLGEAKFYKDGSDAVSQAIKSVKEHLDMGFLKAEKIAVFNKVIKQAPGYDKIEFMLHVDTSVDELTKRMVIPVLITFDSKSLSGTSDLSEKYVESIIAETKLFVDFTEI